MFDSLSMGRNPWGSQETQVGSDCTTSTEDTPLATLTGALGVAGRAQRQVLEAIVACERDDRSWVGDGHRGFAEWLGARLGTSTWVARRRINAAHTLPHLPLLTEALDSGALSLEKVVELCRFATPETERKLIKWAARVTTTTIRAHGDAAQMIDRDVTVDNDRNRSLSYWWIDDGRLMLEGFLPADQGAVVASTLDRMADRLPDILEHESLRKIPDVTLEERRADALVALASAAIARDQDPDRATIVVHADLDILVGEGTAEIENGPLVDAETVRRLACDARIQTAVHDANGRTVGVGRTMRTAPPWLLRLLRHRDRGCTFPNCEMKRFLHAHHIRHWTRGGETDLDNLVLVCTFHHKLVHEYGWRVTLGPDGTEWSKPDGQTYMSSPVMASLLASADP